MLPAADSSSRETNLRCGRMGFSAARTTMWWRGPAWELETLSVPCIQRGRCKWQVLLKAEGSWGKGKWGLSQNASFLQPGGHRVVVNVTCNKQHVLIAAFLASFPTLTVYLEWTSAHLHVWLYLGTQHSPLVHTCIYKPKQYCQLYFGLQPMAY